MNTPVQEGLFSVSAEEHRESEERLKSQLSRPRGLQLLNTIEQGNTEKSMELIALGADLTVKNFYEDTALSLACIHSLPTVALALINNTTVEINNTNKDGSTPLMYASKNGLLNVVKSLLDAGAKINTKNNNGYTARNYAIINNKTETNTYLKGRGANIIKNLIPAARGGSRRNRTRRNKRSRSPYRGKDRSRRSRRS